MLAKDGNVLHERQTDDAVWYLGNMVNWVAMQSGERIEIVKDDEQGAQEGGN